MNRLVKIWLGLFVLILPTILLAQQAGKIENGFNVDSFPKVSFVYHSYNPDVLEKANFWNLKEAGSNREFNVEKLSCEAGDLPQNTLVLWEDMGHNGIKQFDFTKKTLLGFFKRVGISSQDKFAIYAFNRRKNDQTALVGITNGLTNDRYQILSAIQNYKHSTELYREFPNRSDMYTAVREGLDILAPKKDVKAIIVFTSGRPMKNSGADSETQVLLKAQQLHIPVYIFQYYYRSGVASESEGFAKSSFGGFFPHKDVDAATNTLAMLYPQMAERYMGHDYKISFTSDAKRGADARMVVLTVDGVDVQEQLLPPSYTVGSWIVLHLWLVVLIVVLLLAILTGVILFIRKTRKNVSDNRRELANLENRRIQDKQAAEHKIYETISELEVKKKREEEERLWRAMEKRNLYPTLTIRSRSETSTYHIEKPKILVGREQDNDLVLNNNTVSRYHAEIVFNGSDFEIIDKQSTNKVIVDGQFVGRAVLRSGCVIGLGEVTLTFYL